VWVGAGVAIDHLDGGGWTTTHLPNFDLPSALSAVSSTDVWAVGHSSNSNMTAHYDGLDWNDVFIPNRGTAPIQGLESVVARRPNSVWAGGYRGYDYRPSIWHWNGTAWHISKTPGDGNSHQDIVSLDDVPGVRTVWALGGGGMVERFC
jgi:hypothetical protein